MKLLRHLFELMNSARGSFTFQRKHRLLLFLACLQMTQEHLQLLLLRLHHANALGSDHLLGCEDTTFREKVVVLCRFLGIVRQLNRLGGRERFSLCLFELFAGEFLDLRFLGLFNGGFERQELLIDPMLLAELMERRLDPLTQLLQRLGTQFTSHSVLFIGRLGTPRWTGKELLHQFGRISAFLLKERAQVDRRRTTDTHVQGLLERQQHALGARARLHLRTCARHGRRHLPLQHSQFKLELSTFPPIKNVSKTFQPIIKNLFRPL